MNLREAAQQALEALEGWDNYGKWVWPESALEQAKRNTTEALTALKAALAEHDKDRVKVEEMKANWALQRKLAQETEERDRQRREYEEQRLAELEEPVQEPVANEVHLNIIRYWPDGFAERMEHVWKDLIGFIPNYKLYDLQRMLAEFGFTMKVYEGDAPPQRKPLTEEEIDALAMDEDGLPNSHIEFARAIERAHGIGEQP